jgi:hypothetical protein
VEKGAIVKGLQKVRKVESNIRRRYKKPPVEWLSNKK